MPEQIVAAPVGLILVGSELTVREVPLTSFPPGAVTATVPELTPDEGKVTVISVDELMVNVETLVPLTETAVTPERLTPVISKVPPKQALEEIEVILAAAHKVTLRAVELVPHELLVVRTTYSVVAEATKVSELLP